MAMAAPTEDLCFMPAEALADLIRTRRLSPVELMEATLARIEAVNPAINAFVQLDPERAMEAARAQTERLARGEDLGPLGGLPLGVKELENAVGFRSTSGSRVFEHRLPEHDDVHVERLKAAGAIAIGKTNVPEFGYTGFSANDVFGICRNPWKLDRTPGGSSGGSAAAIVSGMAPLVTGSDGAGSIRCPSAFTGAFGIKPTLGMVPIVPRPREMLGWTGFGNYGPITRTVRDAALYLDQVAGYHPLDPTSFPRPVPSFLAALDQPLPRLRIAFNRMVNTTPVQTNVLREVERAVEVFRSLGHEVEEDDHAFEATFPHWVIMSRFQALAQMEDVIMNQRGLMTPGYAADLAGVETIGAREFGEAYRVRSRLNEWLAEFFGRYDLLLTPTMPLEAFAAEGPPPTEVEGQPLRASIFACTSPFNFSGHPAASVRAGFTDAGLPAGLQIVGRRYEDALVLQAAHAYEQALPWSDNWPPL
jgi:aspartyl-tRNA(Asn)/glutamyl-tRNA(Gln) amidotransferase subunit A